jgi:hypothetical protein
MNNHKKREEISSSFRQRFRVLMEMDSTELAAEFNVCSSDVHHLINFIQYQHLHYLFEGETGQRLKVLLQLFEWPRNKHKQVDVRRELWPHLLGKIPQELDGTAHSGSVKRPKPLRDSQSKSIIGWQLVYQIGQPTVYEKPTNRALRQSPKLVNQVQPLWNKVTYRMKGWSLRMTSNSGQVDAVNRTGALMSVLENYHRLEQIWPWASWALRRSIVKQDARAALEALSKKYPALT